MNLNGVTWSVTIHIVTWSVTIHVADPNLFETEL